MDTDVGTYKIVSNNRVLGLFAGYFLKGCMGELHACIMCINKNITSFLCYKTFI